MSTVSLIGSPVGTEFSSLVGWIRSKFPAGSTHEFQDISSWERSGQTATKSQLTIVLQASSDQFTADDVDRLVGATVLTGLLCCYGSWCEGDGRTHQTWPCSSRVPVRYARQVIQQEAHRLDSGRPVLLPTAARDEVFLHRQPDRSQPPTLRKGTALVVGPDRIYRSTLAAVMESGGWNVDHISLDYQQLQNARSPHVMIHDLDPQCDSVTASIEACRLRFPNAELFGVANMPSRFDSSRRREFPVVPKLDPLLAMEQLSTV